MTNLQILNTDVCYNIKLHGVMTSEKKKGLNEVRIILHQLKELPCLGNQNHCPHDLEK